MPLYLDIPYSDKEEAKKLAKIKWEPNIKKWYAFNRSDYKNLGKWILKNQDEIYVICDCFYIVERTALCPNCHSKTITYDYGIEKFFCFFNNIDKIGIDYINDSMIILCPAILSLTSNFFNYLQETNSVQSKSTIKKRLYHNAHICKNCKNYIFDYDYLDEQTFYKFKLKHDEIMNIDTNFFNSYTYISETDKIIQLEYPPI